MASCVRGVRVRHTAVLLLVSADAFYYLCGCTAVAALAAAAQQWVWFCRQQRRVPQLRRRGANAFYDERQAREL